MRYSDPPRIVAMHLKAQQRKILEQKKAEERLARSLEREVSGRSLKKQLTKSSHSFATLKRLEKTSLEPLRRKHENRGERKFLLRFSTEAARQSIQQHTTPWRPSGKTPAFPSAEDLLLQPPPAPPLLPIAIAEVEHGPEAAAELAAELAAAATVPVNIREQVSLMLRGFSEAEAYNHTMQVALRRRRRMLDGAQAEHDDDADDDDDDEHEVARKALLMALRGGKVSRTLEQRRVVDMFHRLGCDPDGNVSKESVRTFVLERATSSGLSDELAAVFANDFDDVFEELWEELDVDGDMKVDFSELYKLLRSGKRMQLRPELREGALGDIGCAAQNAISLRRDKWERRAPSSQLKEVSVLELRHALLSGAAKVIDLFRQLDEDGDGAVSRLEFRRVLPLMGYDASDTEAIDDLFDDLDLDGSGAIAYEELKELLTVDRLAERGIELAAVLQDGALGEIEVTAKNKNSLRGGDVTIRRGEGREASIAALQTQLWSTAGKVSDLFRALDKDGDGVVTQDEFARGMGQLGFQTDEAVLTDIFCSLDASGDGSIEYAELEELLRPRAEIASYLQEGAKDFMLTAKNKHDLRPGGINLLEKQEQERQAYATWLTEQDAAAAAELEAAATRLQSLQRGRLGRRHRAEGTPKDDNYADAHEGAETAGEWQVACVIGEDAYAGISLTWQPAGAPIGQGSRPVTAQLRCSVHEQPLARVQLDYVGETYVRLACAIEEGAAARLAVDVL